MFIKILTLGLGLLSISIINIFSLLITSTSSSTSSSIIADKCYASQKILENSPTKRQVCKEEEVFPALTD